jgi:hypothetical protein
LQGQLYVSQRAWVDIVCWHDELPKLVMRVEPNEEFIMSRTPTSKSSNAWWRCVRVRPSARGFWDASPEFSRLR